MKKILLLLIILFTVNFASAQVTATMVDDAPFNYEDTEIKPEFPGGRKELMTFVVKNFKVPEALDIGGIIKVMFIIEADGSISNIKVTKDLGQGTEEEAKRVISLFPKWSSGERDGKKVRVLFELPINVGG